MSEEKTYSEEQYGDLKNKLDEFRDNNVKLLKNMDDLNGKFKDVDLDQYTEMMKQQRDNKDKKLMDAGKIDELVDERTKRLQEDNAKAYNSLKDENSTYQRQLEGLMIDATVRDHSSKQGVAATAIDDVILRAKTVFQLKEGKATPIDSEGNVIYEAGATEPMSVESWVKGLTGTAPHLFTPSNGSGSQHGNGGAGDDKTVTRSQFDEMSQVQRADFSKKDGKVVDN